MKNDNGPFFLILVPVAAFILYRLSRHITANKDVRNSTTALLISRRQLLRIALWPYIRRMLFFLMPVAFVLAAACIGRRISLVTAIISFMLVSAFFILVCFPRIQSQYLPLKRLKNISGFDEIFAGKQLHWLNGAWGYADDEWFIRVGNEHSVALHAGEINFQQPIRSVSFSWKAPKFKGSGGMTIIICQLRFTGHDGETITACTQTDTNILNWIQSHGGKLSP